MPGFDRSGPQGRGSRTGWGTGRCRDEHLPPEAMSGEERQSGEDRKSEEERKSGNSDRQPAARSELHRGFDDERGAGRGFGHGSDFIRGFARRWRANAGSTFSADTAYGRGRARRWAATVRDASGFAGMFGRGRGMGRGRGLGRGYGRRRMKS